jgi:Rad3-related DNA helicase
LSLKELWKTENQDTIFHYLRYIETVLTSFLSSITILKDKVKKDYPNKKPPREWRNALFISDWVKDIHCKVEDYNKIIKKTSTRNIVKNPTSDEELTFNCLEESYMMNSYFHQYTGFTILMSATFSDPREYMRNMNIKGAKYIKMESLFDFSKSPIYYYPKRRMSYKHIDKNRDWLYAKINEIIEKHEGERGIIHSVSYDLTKKINENLTPKNRKRVFVYSGTEEKRKVLDMMKISKGKIIMGPSLTTGLDLYDDLARFLIFVKTPYPSLADRFIKTKMNINPLWYKWQTVISIIQGLGRPIRNKEDWCVSYYLDGALSDLIHNNRNLFSQELLNRIKIIDE